MAKTYSLRKSRHILKQCYQSYKRQGRTLEDQQVSYIEDLMEKCDEALLEGNRNEASDFASKIQIFCRNNFRSNKLLSLIEMCGAVLLALVIAIVIRQMWFEPYEIPSGSMRPTFREKDNLTVSKTAFGINTPLGTSHLYFDPDLVQRTSVLIFSGDGIDLPDTDSTYFGIFPYKKRYIKRLIGKPGDSLYFYGGKIYGIDKEGQPIQEFPDSPWMKHIDHVPFLSFEGKITAVSQNEALFKQMNQPIGRIIFSRTGNSRGEIFNGKEWVKDQQGAQGKPHQKIETYSDFYGMRNYAKARLLTRNELRNSSLEEISGLEDGMLYLELSHNPSLQYPKPQYSNKFGLTITPYTTVIPLQKEHLNAIMDALYTARFVVKDGKATRYDAGGSRVHPNSPRFPGVPNGTYEFYFGKASKIGWGGLAKQLPQEFPLYSKDPSNVQRLFNFGIEFSTLYSPSVPNSPVFPNRYAYFYEEDLYLMGAPILKKGDPTLQRFLEREEKRAQASTLSAPYVAFRDYGPPIKDGSYDKEFMRTFGITVPEKHYLVLGDNHAMSADSRVFGFVPQANIQGAPCLIFWPFGDRWGHPEQKPYPLLNVPRVIIWTVGLAVGLAAFIQHRRNIRKRIFNKITK